MVRGVLFSATLAAAAAAAVKGPEPLRGLKRGEPRPAVAVLLVGINEVAGSVAEPGWPLIVTASRQPDEKLAAVPLPTDLRVKLTDERGPETTARFEPVPPGPNTGTSLYWIAAETESSRLAPGRYRLTLVTAVGGAPSGWRVEFGEFQVVAPNPERRGAVGQLRMQRSILLGRDDEALAEADRLIAADAKDQNAWIAKGDLLMMKDDPDAALQAFDRALALRKKTDSEGLALADRRRRALQRSLEKRGVVRPP